MAETINDLFKKVYGDRINKMVPSGINLFNRFPVRIPIQYLPDELYYSEIGQIIFTDKSKYLPESEEMK